MNNSLHPDFFDQNTERCNEHKLVRCTGCRAKSGELRLPASRPRVMIPTAAPLEVMQPDQATEEDAKGVVLIADLQTPSYVKESFVDKNGITNQLVDLESHTYKVTKASDKYTKACDAHMKATASIAHAKKALLEATAEEQKAHDDREAARNELFDLISAQSSDEKTI